MGRFCIARKMLHRGARPRDVLISDRAITNEASATYLSKPLPRTRTEKCPVLGHQVRRVRAFHVAAKLPLKIRLNSYFEGKDSVLR